jgi:hypothetical protein
MLRRNNLLQDVTEGKIQGWIEVARSRGRRRKRPLDNLRENTGYWKLKREN